MKKLTLALAGAMALFTSGALADGMSKSATCCDSARSWTGFYAGFGIGAGAVVHDLSFGPVDFDGIGGEGIFGTVVVGYDRQLSSSMVAGIFADYDFSNISTDLSAPGFNASLDHKHSWSIGARLGVLSSPSTLWYGMGGYTQAEYDISSTIGSLNLPTFNGYFVGAGVESQLQGGWSLRGEYRFSQFEKEDVFGIGIEPSMHTARLALTYKWNREEAVAPMK